MLAQNFQQIQQAAGLTQTPQDVGQLISNALPFVYYGAGFGLLIFLIIGGLQLMTAKGDPKAVQAAQGKITNALIGFIVIVFAYTITKLFGEVLNIPQFGLIFK